MKKSLRILVVLSIAASSILFATPSQAVDQFDTVDLVASTTLEITCNGGWFASNYFKFRANNNIKLNKIQVQLERYLENSGEEQILKIYSDSSNNFGSELGSLSVTSHPQLNQSGIATYVAATPINLTLGSYYWVKTLFQGACYRTSATYTETDISLNINNGATVHRFPPGGYLGNESSTFAFFASPAENNPGAPSSVVATATGKRTAIVSFGAPSSNGGSTVTSYTAISTPGGLTQTLTQATGGTFTFDGLQPGTAYSFAVTATNAIGTSAAATSNSVTTTPLTVASLSELSFVDDGTGTGGKIVWSGSNIDAVLYTGSAAYYPGPYNYGAFTSGWNGRIRNLTPDTSYTVSIFAISADGVGESKSLTFKTSATLPALVGSASSTVSQAAQMATQLPKLYAWIYENVFVDGEGDRMKTVLNKFDAVTVPAHSAYLKLPNSTVVKVSATSSTPAVCKVEGQVTVHSIAAGTCTISYTVVGASKAPATLVKDFVFKKFAK